MPLSKRDIIRLTDSVTYYKGEDYFKHGLIAYLTKSADGGVTASVKSSSSEKKYDVNLKFSPDGEKLYHFSCECRAFLNYPGICKHIVAVILQKQDSSAKAPETRRSDNAALLLLKNYAQKIADTASEFHEGNAIFESVLDCGKDISPSLFFRVGEQRLYIVQDLRLMKTHFYNHADSNYGKYRLSHSIASFREECRPIVKYYLKNYDDYNYIYNPDSRGYMYSGDRRNMYLSPKMTDEYFSLMAENGSVFVRDERKSTRKVRIISEDYRPQLILAKTYGGALLTHDEDYELIRGDRNVYIVTKDNLYRCGADFNASCFELLDMLKKSDGKLFFAQNDINVLFSAVLPKIAPFASLEINGDFEQYEPLPLVTKIYLDSAGDGSITARMTFTYGDKTTEAFRAKSVSSPDIAGEILAETLMMRYFGNTLYDDGTVRIVNDTDAVYRFITEGIASLSEIAELFTTDAFGKIKIRPPAIVTVGVKMNAGLLDVDFEMDGVDLSELPEILASYRAAKKYHRLRDGTFLSLEETAMSGLSELAEGLDLTGSQLTSGHARLPSSRALYLDAVCKRNEEMRINRDGGFKRILRDMREIEDADFPVPEELRRVLRNYQKNGYRWLKTIGAYGFGGILADDMGLGKTLQILALLKSGYDENKESAPSIVICPASLSLNWESEAQKFTPDLKTVVITGTAADRASLIERIPEYGLAVTSYDLLKRDVELYEKINFKYIIIDEAQYIKNQATQNAKSVKALNGEIRLALTGTPVENSLAELWSIFDFLMPGYLFTYNRFRKKFEEPIVKSGAKEASGRLKQLIQPFLLRRLKSDVLKELPPKTETTLRSFMESKQKKIYTANLAQVKKDLAMQMGLPAGQDRIKILAALTRLRQICCDPSLVYENYNGGSVKLDACLELIENCIDSGRRMLLFSQFTSMLDIIGKRLDENKTAFLRIDGSTKPAHRLELVNSFNSGSVPVFLISLKAGGTGLNLTGADTVIHYDPWWNISAQNQATDRAHRIGQKNNVQVYKLIVKDTVEERILKMQEQKADLANTVISENADPFEKLNREDLLALFDAS